MKKIIVFSIFLSAQVSHAQSDERITSLDFVQVLNDNYEETIYYYENNWKVLREWAIKENYIASYDFIQTKPTEEQPFQIILVTTYANQGQFDNREINFEKLIERRGGRRLKNEIQPADFRKILFSKETSRHGFTIR